MISNDCVGTCGCYLMMGILLINGIKIFKIYRNWALRIITHFVSSKNLYCIHKVIIQDTADNIFTKPEWLSSSS